MHVPVHVYKYACTRMHVPICMYPCVYVPVCMYPYVCTRSCTCMFVFCVMFTIVRLQVSGFMALGKLLMAVGK
jgi:hypothetical protein